MRVSTLDLTGRPSDENVMLQDRREGSNVPPSWSATASLSVLPAFLAPFIARASLSFGQSFPGRFIDSIQPFDADGHR